jgi:predicted TPR repeat methyltransferase
MDAMSVSDLLQEGRQHHAAGRVEAAEALYRHAVEQDPKGVDARLRLGMVLQDLGRLVEATEVLGQLVVDHPRLAAGWAQLARAIVPQGFAWEAHGAISRAMRAKPDADTLVTLSVLHLAMQDKDAAESACRRAVKMSPASVSAWMQLGQILAIRGKKPEAATAYQRVLEHDPGNSLAMFFLTAQRGDPIGPDVSGTITIAPPQYVRALFDGCAERFDGLLVGDLKYRTPQMLDLMYSQWRDSHGPDATGSLQILDAGCGTGLCGLWLARYRGWLIGVDLSRRMMAEAQDKQVYDQLVPGDVVEELKTRPDALDLIVAADVMVYFGELGQFFAAAANALRPGGVFLFSVETAVNGDYLLLPTQRFAHSIGYLDRLADSNGFALRVKEQATLRKEEGADVRGYLVLAERVQGPVSQPV